MKILAVDTASKSCSVAIIHNDVLMAEMTLASGQTHSKHLMDMIRTVIRISGLSISDLDGFAVTKGPGSFTGLRIGISSVKGLAAGSGKPVVSVSSLETLAMQSEPSPYLICPLLDARKGEVYFSRYRLEGGILKKEIEERVCPPIQAVCDLDEPCLFIGDGAFLHKKLILDQIGELANFAPAFANMIRASTVAHISMIRFKKKDTDDLGTLVPSYIRKSDAELNFRKKHLSFNI
jgi:tRNA threonylcarbamoyladenosine biosynthesis protein TsaB